MKKKKHTLLKKKNIQIYWTRLTVICLWDDIIALLKLKKSKALIFHHFVKISIHDFRIDLNSVIMNLNLARVLPTFSKTIMKLSRMKLFTVELLSYIVYVDLNMMLSKTKKCNSCAQLFSPNIMRKRTFEWSV